MVKGWFIGIVCAAILAAVADTLLAGSGQRHIGRLAGTMMILLMVLRPVLGVGGFEGERLIDNLTENLATYDGLAGEGTGQIMKKIIEEQVNEYLKEKMEQMQITADVAVECKPAEGDLWIPDRIVVIGAVSAKEKIELEEYIEKNLGVGRDRQIYEDGDGGGA